MSFGPDVSDHQDFWREVAEDCCQLDVVLDLIDSAPQLLGDLGEAGFGADDALAIAALQSALHRVRRISVDRLQRLALLKGR